MPQISFRKNRPSIAVPVGANLMQSLLAAGLPVASSCSGEGVCSKCRIEIVSGMENLTEPNETEIFLLETHHWPKNFRISCQTQVLGDIEIDTSYW